MVASSEASKRCRYSSFPPGYSVDNVASSKGSVRPKSMAKDSPLWPRPAKTAVGASTHGVRMPPRARPCSSRTEAGPVGVDLEPGCRRGRLAASRPPRQVGQGGLGDVVLLGSGVDRRVRPADHEVRRGAQQLGHALQELRVPSS